MTREQCQQLLPVIQAFANGETIQRDSGDGKGWLDVIDPMFVEGVLYRVKPKPKLVPWTMEDVPPVCWIRRSGDSEFVRLVIAIGKSCVYLPIFLHDRIHLRTDLSYNFLLTDNYEYSTDLKTWHRCGKEV